jgi:DNA-binding LytR/AlgR family response regulator
VQAFEAKAVDDLLKPVTPERLDACVRRLRDRLAAGDDAAASLDQAVARLRGLLASAPAGTAPPRVDGIQAQVGQTVYLVPLDEVVCFEAADKTVRVVTAQREHLIRTPRRERLPRLDPAKFWQVHRGTVVQARCIAAARRDESGKAHLTLRGRPETITASRLYAPLFKGM